VVFAALAVERVAGRWVGEDVRSAVAA